MLFRRVCSVSQRCAPTTSQGRQRPRLRSPKRRPLVIKYCPSLSATVVPMSRPAEPSEQTGILQPTSPRKLQARRYAVGDQYTYTRLAKIYPLQFSHPTRPWILPVPGDWEKYDHPEGAPWYHNRRLQVVTYSNVLDKGIRERIETAAQSVLALMKEHVPADRLGREMGESSGAGVSLDESVWHYGIDDWDLCLEVDPDSDVCLYYLVSWARHCVWWPEPVDTARIGAEGMACDEQLHWSIQCYFWNHVEYFPHHRSLPADAIDKLEGTLTFFSHDLLTSKESTMSFTRDEIGAALQLIHGIKGNPNATPELTAIVGRQMAEICEERAYNLHGTPLARMSRFQSRYAEPHCNRAIPENVFARAFTFVFLFNKPRSFDRKLCESWIDNSAFYIQWKELMRDVQEEWKGSAFLATVMLAANMGFLTIDGKPDLPIAAKTLSVISTSLSLGSIVSGLLLGHQHRSLETSTTTAFDASLYFMACESRWLGLYGAAMLFSVPLAMLMWAFLLFVGGVLWYSFTAFSPLARPFIMTAVGLIFVVIVVQGIYFHGLGPAPKGSRWKRVAPAPNITRMARQLMLAEKPSPPRTITERLARWTEKVTRVLRQTGSLPPPTTAPSGRPGRRPALSVALPRELFRRMSTGLSGTTRLLASPGTPATPYSSRFPSFRNKSSPVPSPQDGASVANGGGFDPAGSVELGSMSIAASHSGLGLSERTRSSPGPG